MSISFVAQEPVSTLARNAGKKLKAGYELSQVKDFAIWVAFSQLNLGGFYVKCLNCDIINDVARFRLNAKPEFM